MVRVRGILMGLRILPSRSSSPYISRIPEERRRVMRNFLDFLGEIPQKDEEFPKNMWKIPHPNLEISLLTKTECAF
jgi:hypothetical protein